MAMIDQQRGFDWAGLLVARGIGSGDQEIHFCVAVHILCGDAGKCVNGVPPFVVLPITCRDSGVLKPALVWVMTSEKRSAQETRAQGILLPRNALDASWLPRSSGRDRSVSRGRWANQSAPIYALVCRFAGSFSEPVAAPGTLRSGRDFSLCTDAGKISRRRDDPLERSSKVDGFCSSERSQIVCGGFILRSLCSPYLPIARLLRKLRLWVGQDPGLPSYLRVPASRPTRDSEPERGRKRGVLFSSRSAAFISRSTGNELMIWAIGIPRITSISESIPTRYSLLGDSFMRGASSSQNRARSRASCTTAFE